MILRTLTKQQVEEEPHRVWAAYLDLLSNEESSALSHEQRAAQLVLWYESDFVDGGHVLYFENRGTAHLAETVKALGMLGALGQQEVLREAGDWWLSRPRPPAEASGEDDETEIVSAFEGFDSQLRHCAPDLIACLQRYLYTHQEQFVRIE